MKSALPKVLHRLAGKPMIGHVADAVAPLKPARTIVVTSAGNERVAAAVPGAIAAVQDPPRGTGDAVRAARRALRGFDGDVLVLYGDVPLIRPETLQAMVKALRSRKAPGRRGAWFPPGGSCSLWPAGDERRRHARRHRRVQGCRRAAAPHRPVQCRADGHLRPVAGQAAGGIERRQCPEGISSDRCRRHRPRQGPVLHRHRSRRGRGDGHQQPGRACRRGSRRCRTGCAATGWPRASP